MSCFFVGFCFVEKMDDFQYGLLEFSVFHERILTGKLVVVSVE